MTPNNDTNRSNGFSLVESISVVAILAILALIAIPLAGKIRPTTHQTKTQSSVSQLNTAIDLYLSNGGDLDTANTPNQVLARLKTRMNSASGSTFVGFTGSAIDQRLKAVTVGSDAEGVRAVYNKTRKKFEVTSEAVEGFRFELDENYEGNGIGEVETRNSGLFEYSNNSTWVWDYTDATKADPLELTAVTQTPVVNEIPVALYDPETPVGPETPELKKLLPPVFSLPPGDFELGNFPMSLEIINPNEAGKIVYGLVNEGSWGWNEYSGPIVISPGTQVVAYIESWRPQQYHNSSTTQALYDWNAKLRSPWFNVSENAISEEDGVASIEIKHDNNVDYFMESGLMVPEDSFIVQYRIAPLNGGPGSETGWLTYSMPFDVAAANYSAGFTVYAKVTSKFPGISESWVNDTSVSTFDPDNPPGSELEYTTNYLNLSDGDSFNIRDYVRVKSDPTEAVDWDKAFFTYTEAGANNPPNPADWHLSAFNSGNTVTVTEADRASFTGNSGNGIYKVYLARNGVPTFDDVLTIRISERAPAPGLSPPIFDPKGGYFHSSNFPLEVTLTDPNPPGRGKIVYTINGESNDYTGPITVEADTKVYAYIESLDTSKYSNSSTASEHYRLSVEPNGPWVWASKSEIEASTGSTTVYIGFTNQSHLSYEIQYQLRPLVPGEGAETAWTPYHGGFSVGAPQFPKGFEIASKIVPSDSAYSEIFGEVETVTTYVQLQAPTINSNVDSINAKNPEALITLENPNPSGTSEMAYRTQSLDGSQTSAWSTYSNPFIVKGSDFPEGVKIIAKATPLDPVYRESSESVKAISGKFFDIDITWKTIFILDSSGSMVTNDRLARLQSQVVAVISEFGEDDSFAIIDYDDSAAVISDWGPGTESRIQSAIASLSSMEAGGATNYHSALEAALSLAADDATQVIFLSDGLPFAPEASNPENTDGIVELVEDLISSGVERLDTIGFGLDSQILKDMASAGGGESVVISD